MKAPLRDIAHGRTGDKGDTCNISLWVQEPAHYPAMKAQLTEARARAAFGVQSRGEVTIHWLDHLHGANVVLTRALGGGVNQSLNLDAHGKSFAFILLGIEIELGDGGASW
jgi:hypothetical protein